MKKLCGILLVFTLIASILPTYIYAQEDSNAIYISGNGDDTNSGLTENMPVKSIEKAFALVPDGGRIIAVNTCFSAQPVVTPAKAVTLTALSPDIAFFSRWPLTLGGDLTIENIHIAFEDADLNIDTNVRSIFVNGHTLTVRGTVDTENAGRYPNIYAGNDTGVMNGNSVIHLESGTYNLISGGGKGYAVNGETTIRIGGDAAIITGIDGTEDHTAFASVTISESRVTFYPSVFIRGNLDLFFQAVRPTKGALSFGSIENIRDLRLESSGVSVSLCSVGRNFALPSGSALSAPVISVSGDFSGGGTIGTASYFSVGGTASGVTTVNMLDGISPADGGVLITAGKSDSAQFQLNHNRYTLMETVSGEKTAWVFDKIEIPVAKIRLEPIDTILPEEYYTQLIIGTNQAQRQLRIDYYDENDKYIMDIPQTHASVSVRGNPDGISVEPLDGGMVLVTVSADAPTGLIELEASLGEVSSVTPVMVLGGNIPKTEYGTIYIRELTFAEDGTLSFTALSEVDEYAPVEVYAALYDSSGMMTAISVSDCTQLEYYIDRQFTFPFSREQTEQAAELRVFMWNTDMSPVFYFIHRL